GRAEFATARACARAAFARLGLPPFPVTNGDGGEPQWPSGLVGSITHCEGYRACAVARSNELLTVGIDAEPHAPLPEGVLGEVARPEELSLLERLDAVRPEVHWDRLLFSAKEAAYKAWYPLAKRRLGFEQLSLTLDAAGGRFDARPPACTQVGLSGLSGRWLVRDGLILTAVAPLR